MLDRYIQGYEGYGIAIDSRGVEMPNAAKGIPVAGWFVATVLPTAEAFAPIRAMQQRMLLATIFLTLLAGGLTWWMLKRQFSPMLAAVHTMATRSGANLPPQPLPIAKQDEIGELLELRQRAIEMGKAGSGDTESQFYVHVLHPHPVLPIAVDAGRYVGLDRLGMLFELAAAVVLETGAADRRAQAGCRPLRCRLARAGAGEFSLH